LISKSKSSVFFYTAIFKNRTTSLSLTFQNWSLTLFLVKTPFQNFKQVNQKKLHWF